MSELKACPNCENVGWYPEQRLDRRTGEAEWEQVQCEFCYTEPDSIFNFVEQQKAPIIAEVERLKAELAEARNLVVKLKAIHEIGIELSVMNQTYIKHVGDLPEKSLRILASEIKRLTDAILEVEE